MINWDLSVSYKEKNFRFFEKKLAKNFLTPCCVAIEFVLTPLNSAQITALDSGSTRANVFCSLVNKKL